MRCHPALHAITTVMRMSGVTRHRRAHRLVEVTEVTDEAFMLFEREEVAASFRASPETDVPVGSGCELSRVAGVLRGEKQPSWSGDRREGWARCVVVIGGELDPLTHSGSATPVDPVLASSMEAVSQLNQLFDDDTFTDADALGIFTHLEGKTAEDARLVTQRDANSEPQFLARPDLKPAVVNALITAATNHRGMTDELLDDDAKLRRFIEIIGRALYRDGKDAA